MLQHIFKSAIVLFIFLIISCKSDKLDIKKSLPYYNTSDFNPEWNVKKHRIPPFKFINQLGDTVSNSYYKNRIYLTNFIFTTCPGICPKLTINMYVLDSIYKNNKDVFFLSHTVLPEYDSIEVLNTYCNRNNISPLKWNVVTGEKKELYKTAREGYFADNEIISRSDEFIHTEKFILVDKEGYIRGVYNGTLELETKRIQRHINMLLNEK
jgi:protein SCO1